VGILFGGGVREKRAAGGWTGEPIISPIRGTDVNGATNVASNPDQALQVSTVWACVSLIARSVSMLPLETFRMQGDIHTRITDPKLVTTPSPGMTQSEWLHMLVVSLCMRGNAFGEITDRDGNGNATQVSILNPDAVNADVDPDTGDLVYKYGAKQRVIPPQNMWHMRGFTLPGRKVGLSPIAYAAATIDIDISSRKFAGDFFHGGGIPKAILTSDQEINQTQATTIKERLLAATRNREPIVLGAGLDYHALGVTPNESQFLETQRANVPQIARYFGLDPEMVGGSSGGSLTYASVEMRGISFLTYSLSWWLKRIEDAMFPLMPQAAFVKFDTEALLRTDAETSAKTTVQYLAGKVITPTEARAKRNMAPMTLDQRKESNMVPLSITPLGAAKAEPNLKELPYGVPPMPAPSAEPVDNEGAPASVL